MHRDKSAALHEREESVEEVVRVGTNKAESVIKVFALQETGSISFNSEGGSCSQRTKVGPSGAAQDAVTRHPLTGMECSADTAGYAL